MSLRGTGKLNNRRRGHLPRRGGVAVRSTDLQTLLSTEERAGAVRVRTDDGKRLVFA